MSNTKLNSKKIINVRTKTTKCAPLKALSNILPALVYAHMHNRPPLSAPLCNRTRVARQSVTLYSALPGPLQQRVGL